MADNDRYEDAAEMQAGASAEEAVWREYCIRFRELRNMYRTRWPDTLEYPLRCFNIESNIVEAVIENDTSLLSGIKELDSCKTVEDYYSSIKLQLKCKEIYQAIKVRRFDQLNTTMKFQYDSNGRLEWCGISVPGLAGKRPADYVIVQGRSGAWMDRVKIENRMVDGCIILSLDKSYLYVDKKDEQWNIYFVQPGYDFLDYHRAIENFREKPRMQMIVIENMEYYRSPFRPQQDKINFRSTNKPDLQARLDKLDECQLQAVLGILRAKCWPKAYIIYGLPGTGKTHTIVEAVVQIFERSDMNVLVCAGSKNCADYLHEKLEPLVPRSSVLRLRTGEKSVDVYRGHRIVVTTNVKASGLINRKTFDYVFIDEANHTEIHETLVPIQLLKHEGCLVLAGDLNLLNYVARSTRVLDKGLDKSLLKHIFDCEVYKRDNDSGNWNSDYIALLTKCYRSDKRIMSTLNELFYNGSIESSYQTPESLLSGMQLSWPVQFMPVTGPEETPVGAISAQNEDEANTCLNIIVRLHKMGCNLGQIGVISPFKMQVELIKSKLRNAFETLAQRDQCKVGTIDRFQGEEREIIIISTVGSSSHTEDSQFHLFVSDPNRFNLAISRAKWLVIIVGNLGALNRGDYLPRLIENGKIDEIKKWPVQWEQEDPFRQATSSFRRRDEHVV